MDIRSRLGGHLQGDGPPAQGDCKAYGPVANTDTKLLIYGLFQKGRVLAQDGIICNADSAVSAYRANARFFPFSSPSATAWSRNLNR